MCVMNKVAVASAFPSHLHEKELLEMAYDIARGLRTNADIYRSFGITEAVFKEHVENQEWFKRVLEAAMIEWAATGSTKTRIQHQAALALEQGIIPLTGRMVDDEEDLGKAVEVAKLLAKIAGIDTTVPGVTPGEKFVIQINLGADRNVKIETEINPGPATIEAQASASQVPEIDEGASNGDPLRQLSQATASLA